MSVQASFVPYPKPVGKGGTLIRRVVKFFKTHDLSINTHILIAVSGGSDSMALAHLLTNYGRKMTHSSKIRLLHINHGWRGSFSDQDAEFVCEMGRKWNVCVDVFSLKNLKIQKGDSMEAFARRERKRIFRGQSEKWGSVSGPATVLTAHHSDDLAETVIWRMLTGAFWTHGAGILARHESEARPFLTTRKSELVQYLIEEKIPWREDITNHEGRFLRSQMRLELMPTLEKIFPKGVEHLIQLAQQMSDKRHRGSSLGLHQ